METAVILMLVGVGMILAGSVLAFILSASTSPSGSGSGFARSSHEDSAGGISTGFSMEFDGDMKVGGINIGGFKAGGMTIGGMNIGGIDINPGIGPDN